MKHGCPKNACRQRRPQGPTQVIGHRLRRCVVHPERCGVLSVSVAGITVGKGKGVMRLSNEHSVILDLEASMEGAALSLGVDGMIVSMKK